ncbi:MAG TPA: hypothetical protein VH331_02545 [Allosphingosinicella sp.]|jgi:hypothetical protein|nr:hypothetical protein [Allosphingosinicella sp.]
MADYVLYCLDGQKLVRCERFTAADDDEAVRESLRRQGTQAAELWCGPHRVRMFAREPIPH